MGNSHRSDIPIGKLLELELGAQARCQRCRSHRIINLAKLVAAKGPDYSLFNRCCPCRMKRDCGGRVRFFRCSPFLPLFSEMREYYWNELDYLEKVGSDPLWQRQEAWRRVCDMFDRRRAGEAELRRRRSGSRG